MSKEVLWNLKYSLGCWWFDRPFDDKSNKFGMQVPHGVLTKFGYLPKKKFKMAAKKSKMAAKKISFYRFTPQEEIYVINSKNIKVLSHFDEYFGKKILTQK